MEINNDITILPDNMKRFMEISGLFAYRATKFLALISFDCDKTESEVVQAIQAMSVGMRVAYNDPSRVSEEWLEARIKEEIEVMKVMKDWYDREIDFIKEKFRRVPSFDFFDPYKAEYYKLIELRINIDHCKTIMDDISFLDEYLGLADKILTIPYAHKNLLRKSKIGYVFEKIGVAVIAVSSIIGAVTGIYIAFFK